MAEFLNEQEQVDVIKSVWKRYGNALLSLLVIAMLVMVGVRYWQGRQAQQLTEASAAYQQLLAVVNTNNAIAVEMQAHNLMQNAQHTPYAAMAALLLAAEQVNAKQLSAAQDSLNWVLIHAQSTEVKAIATTRLARILISEGHAQQALDLLKAPPTGFVAVYAMVSGDAYVQQNNAPAAYQAYHTALANLSPNNDLVPVIVVKLSNLPVTASQSATNVVKG